MEASSADAVAGSLAKRDADIRAYFEGEVLKCLLVSDPAEKLVALTREICGLKLSHSQLVASQAAARKRADAASMTSVALKQSLQVHLQGRSLALCGLTEVLVKSNTNMLPNGL